MKSDTQPLYGYVSMSYNIITLIFRKEISQSQSSFIESLEGLSKKSVDNGSEVTLYSRIMPLLLSMIKDESG